MYLNEEGIKLYKDLFNRLTVTYDVFKYSFIRKFFIKYLRLTVTYDVFKYTFIRIFFILNIWLTVTYDVFK